jgi:predicted SAM-dependent methyltransferase
MTAWTRGTVSQLSGSGFRLNLSVPTARITRRSGTLGWMNHVDSGSSNGLRVPPNAARTTGERATRLAKKGASVGRSVITGIPAGVRGRFMRSRARARLATIPGPRRLCLGSGGAPIPGWVNIDLNPPADVLLDLRFGIPVPTGTIDTIYSEHLVEHLPLEAAMALFGECRRVLEPRGVMRVATPDLEQLVTDYRRDWRSRHDWINWPEYGYIDTPVRMINVAVREWGHQYLYDFAELSLRMTAAGFGHVERVELGTSAFPQLCGLETRADSRLIVEARPIEPSDATIREEAS